MRPDTHTGQWPAGDRRMNRLFTGPAAERLGRRGKGQQETINYCVSEEGARPQENPFKDGTWSLSSLFWVGRSVGEWAHH